MKFEYRTSWTGHRIIDGLNDAGDDGFRVIAAHPKEFKAGDCGCNDGCDCVDVEWFLLMERRVE